MLTGKFFQKKKENFTCEHCGSLIIGNGYTNHCPRCLWSKHVDVHPGDRLSSCGGMMEPVHIEIKKGEYVILHKCCVCAHQKRNKIASNDDFDAILKIVKKPLY